MSDLTALALNAAHQLPVAELHGAVCGLGVCHPGEPPVADLVDLVGAESLTRQDAVTAFVAACLDDLGAEDMGFMPLLPDDDSALEERLDALGQWCGAFLAGLAAGLARRGIVSLEDCPEEVREIVRDFAAIARVGVDEAAGAGGESAEADLVELQEFVKVGVLLLSSLLADEPDDPAG